MHMQWQYYTTLPVVLLFTVFLLDENKVTAVAAMCSHVGCLQALQLLCRLQSETNVALL